MWHAQLHAGHPLDYRLIPENLMGNRFPNTDKQTPVKSPIDTKPRVLFTLLRRLWQHLNKRRQHQFILLLGMMVMSAFAEVISLGAVLPFLGVLISPDRVFQRPIVASMASTFRITSASELVLPITLAFVFAAREETAPSGDEQGQDQAGLWNGDAALGRPVAGVP